MRCKCGKNRYKNSKYCITSYHKECEFRAENRDPYCIVINCFNRHLGWSAWFCKHHDKQCSVRKKNNDLRGFLDTLG